MVRKGLLVVPLDGQSVWHRFHPIFGEFLLERLRRKEATNISNLHRRAARWFASEGLRNDAIRHAKAGADIEFTIRLLAQAGGWLIAFRGGTKTLRIISDLPDEVLDAHPYLRLGQIYLLAQESQLEEARTMFNRVTERALAGKFHSAQEEQLFSVSAGALEALLNIYEVRRVDPQRLLLLSQRCDAHIPKQLSAMVSHLLGFAHYCEGNYLEARRVCTAAAEHCRAVDADFVAVYSYFALGDSHLEMAALEQAERCFRVALELASQFGSSSHQVSAAQIFLAEVAYERDEIDLAASLIEQAMPGIEHRDPWSSVYMSGHRVAAEILMRRAGCDAAIEFLEQALGRLENHELRDIYAPYLRVKMSEILARAGSIGAASCALRDESLRRENHEQQRQRSDLLRVLASARLTLIQGGGDVAVRQLDRLIPALRGRNQRRRLIKVHALKAAGYHQQNLASEAERAIRAAFSTAKATGMVAPILEEIQLLAPLLNDNPAAAQLLSQLRGGAECARQVAAVHQLAPAVSELTATDRVRLSKREKQILCMLADGLSGKEIAVATNIAVNTVLGYRKSLYRKLEATSRSAAIAAGRKLGYLNR
jgi:ATP/maltotriose-dependent transcriptional regulator MalT